jgi:hypothetical protein
MCRSANQQALAIDQRDATDADRVNMLAPAEGSLVLHPEPAGQHMTAGDNGR